MNGPPMNLCVIVTGPDYGVGYRYQRREGRDRYAHHVAWEKAHGPIPEGMHVCHSCDVRACIEPTHLWLGTRAENMADMVAKGRQTRGVRQHCAKLTPTLVGVIRRMMADPRPPAQTEVAEMFGVSQTNVSFIKRGVTW